MKKDRRTAVLQLRLTPKELARYKRLAAKAGLKLSEWMRRKAAAKEPA